MLLLGAASRFVHNPAIFERNGIFAMFSTNKSYNSKHFKKWSKTAENDRK
jgi:hypothetical protein